MREIKFRAWFEGHMYEVAKLDFWGNPDQASCDLVGTGENGEWEEPLFDIYVSDVELMQSTGMKDKNGKEIYEGDIVDGFAGEHYQGIWEYQNRFAIEFGWTQSMWDMLNCDRLEVIGNIYEDEEND